jgi:hypothetical protein
MTHRFGGEAQDDQSPTLTRHALVMEALNDNFEQGLIKLKELVKDDQNGSLQVKVEEKEQIITLLLSLATKGFKSE